MGLLCKFTFLLVGREEILKTNTQTQSGVMLPELSMGARKYNIGSIESLIPIYAFFFFFLLSICSVDNAVCIFGTLFSFF